MHFSNKDIQSINPEDSIKFQKNTSEEIVKTINLIKEYFIFGSFPSIMQKNINAPMINIKDPIISISKSILQFSGSL